MKNTMKLNVILILIAVSSIASFIAMKEYKGDNAEKWIGKPAPELSQGEWINSKPLALSELRGQVVMIDFWAFGCYNCRNTIPHNNQWYKQYGNEKFKIIGVHTPEFPKEKVFSKVEDETFKLGIEYAVVTDNDYKTWNAYKQQYWPTLYIIDKKGIIRYAHIGEGNYDETENMIRSLLEEK